MNKRKKIFLIIGIIIIGVVISGITTIVILNLKNDKYIYKTIHLEGLDIYSINLEKHRGDTLIFSFTTEPNGLIECFACFDFFIATNITNHEVVLPDYYSCSLIFINLELFNITISLKMIFK